MSWPHQAVICDYSLDEMRKVYKRKFPHKIAVFENFASFLETSVDIIPVSKAEIHTAIAEKIRDKKDLPILLAALSAKVEGIITGDKDFLESGIVKPKMLSPAEFKAPTAKNYLPIIG